MRTFPSYIFASLSPSFSLSHTYLFSGGRQSCRMNRSVGTFSQYDLPIHIVFMTQTLFINGIETSNGGRSWIDTGTPTRFRLCRRPKRNGRRGCGCQKEHGSSGSRLHVVPMVATIMMIISRSIGMCRNGGGHGSRR